MDMRTGHIYNSLEDATKAGVPANSVEPVGVDGGIVTILNGPFVGRRYEQANGKRGRRVRTDATRADVQALLAQRGEQETTP